MILKSIIGKATEIVVNYNAEVYHAKSDAAVIQKMVEEYFYHTDVNSPHILAAAVLQEPYDQSKVYSNEYLRQITNDRFLGWEAEDEIYWEEYEKYIDEMLEENKFYTRHENGMGED